MKTLLSFVLVLAAVAASAATYPNKFVTNATPENVAWTNTAEISVLTNALGTGIVPVIRTRNATAAALGAQQNSPAIILEGQGYNTTGSTSAPVSMGFVGKPQQGTTPTAQMHVVSSIGGSAPANTGTYWDGANYHVGGNLTAGSSLTAGAGAYIGWNGRSLFLSPVDGTMSLMNNATTGFTLLILGQGSSSAALPASTNWPALRVESSTNNVTLGIRKGTNTTEFAGIAASALLLKTNYVAADFTNNIAGTSRLVISNDVLYFVTATKTNLISDGR